MDDTARLIVAVLFASFVIERIVAAVAFLTDTPKSPEQGSERKAKIRRFLLTAVLGAVAVGLAHIRILARLNTSISPWIDYPMSWLVLVAGADKIRDLVGGAPGGGGPKPAASAPPIPPIVINITDRDGHTTLHDVKAS